MKQTFLLIVTSLIPFFGLGQDAVWNHERATETDSLYRTAIEKFIDDCEGEGVAGWSVEDSEEEGETWNHVRFVRIGEEREDVHVKGHFAYEDIVLIRKVEF